MMVIRDLLFCYLFIGAVASEFSLIEYRSDFRTQEALIFENCENNYEHVILHDETNKFSPIFFQQLHDKFHSIMCYNKEYNHSKDITHVKKVDAIIMTVSLRSSLFKALQKIKKVMWWNVLTSVYILHVGNSDCKFAHKILRHAVRNHVLTSYFLCINEKNSIQVYTVNPFPSRASSGWKKSGSDNVVTFYERKYNPNAICEGFNFDRSKKLNGYKITISIPINQKEQLCGSKNPNYSRTEKNNNCSKEHFHAISDALVKRLNVTVMISIIRRRSLIQLFNHTYKNKEENEKLIQQVQNTGRDLILYNVGLKFMKNRSLYFETYPLAWEAIGIATYNHGYKTIGEKIWDFYGIWTILFTIIVLMVTFAVIWFSESRRAAFAVFEVIRLLISHNLHTRMNTLPLRIFFITVLIYFLIIQATFSGHLAKFLTHPELRKQVETMEDLKLLGHTNSKFNFSININKNLRETFAQRVKNTITANECLRYTLLNDSSNACVLDHAALLWYSRESEKLYVPKKPSSEEYYSYLMNRNWVLVNRVNLLFMSLEDFGFRRLWSNDNLINSLIRNLTVTEATSDEDFHPITLEHLMFSFWILTIGLLCATISFCVEVFMTKKLKWNVIPFMKNVMDRTLEKVTRIKISRPRRSVVFFRKK